MSSGSLLGIYYKLFSWICTQPELLTYLITDVTWCIVGIAGCVATVLHDAIMTPADGTPHYTLSCVHSRHICSAAGLDFWKY